MIVELCVIPIDISRVKNLTWAHQHGLRLVARFHAVQRMVEELPPVVPQALPTLCGPSVPPEKNQGCPRILTEAPRNP
jgi:hypothetical protein